MSTSGAATALTSIRDLMSQLKGCAADFESFMAQQVNHLDTLQERLHSQARLTSPAPTSPEVQAEEIANHKELETEITRLREELEKAESLGRKTHQESQQSVKDAMAERDSLRALFETEKKRLESLQQQMADEREEWKAELKLMRRALETQQPTSDSNSEIYKSQPPIVKRSKQTPPRSGEPAQRSQREVTLTLDDGSQECNPALDQVMEQFKQLQATFADDPSNG